MAAVTESNGNGGGNGNAPAPPEKINWKINEPVEGELEFDSGKPVSSKYDGDQVRYTLVDGRVMYVPPAVAAEIERLEIFRAIPFRIYRKQLQAGNRKGTTWVVERIDGWEPPQEAPPAVQAQTAPPQATSRTTTSAAASSAPLQGTPSPASDRMASAVAGAESVSQILCGAFARCGIAAIEAVADVEGKAKDLGMDGFQFGAENVQKLWVTLFIGFKDATVGGRR